MKRTMLSTLFSDGWLERFQFKGDLNAQTFGAFAELLAVFHGDAPLLGGWYDLAFPDIFTEHVKRFLASNS